MKTLKIITTFAALNLILFLSNTAFANPVKMNTGDIVKSGVKKQITAVETSISKTSSALEIELNYLRFDANKFSTENTVTELPAVSTDYLRFDVNNFVDACETEITELPAASEFGYLRFDVSDFTENTPEISEMPENEFDYLRFEVTNFTGSGEGIIDELPGR